MPETLSAFLVLVGVATFGVVLGKIILFIMDKK
jgi:hypothetical protein